MQCTWGTPYKSCTLEWSPKARDHKQGRAPWWSYQNEYHWLGRFDEHIEDNHIKDFGIGGGQHKWRNKKQGPCLWWYWWSGIWSKHGYHSVCPCRPWIWPSYERRRHQLGGGQTSYYHQNEGEGILPLELARCYSLASWRCFFDRAWKQEYKHWTMKRVDLGGDGGRRHVESRLTRGGVIEGRRKEDEDGSTIEMEWIRKMYDSVNTRLNLDTNDGKGVENGSRRIKNGMEFGGYVWLKFKKSIDSVFTCGEFPHRWSIVGKNGILMHGQGQQRGKVIINLAYTLDWTVL